MRFFFIVVCLSVVFLLIGCRATKMPVKKSVAYVDSNELSKRVYSKAIEYDGVIIRGVKVTVNNDQGSNKLKLNIKIKKDSAIFVSIANILGVEITRALLTKDTIKLIDRINKNYLEGSYQHISKMYNLPFDIFVLEKVIINPNYLFNDIELKNKNILYEENYYRTFTIFENQEISYLIGAADFTIYENSYKFIKSNKKVNIKYLDYVNTGERYYPKKVEIFYTDYKKETNLIIDYNNVEFVKIDNFKLEVPRNYSKIYTD